VVDLWPRHLGVEEGFCFFWPSKEIGLPGNSPKDSFGEGGKVKGGGLILIQLEHSIEKPK